MDGQAQTNMSPQLLRSWSIKKTLTELQVRGVWRIIQRYFFLIVKKNICSDPSLEPSQQGGSSDGSQNMGNYP